MRTFVAVLAVATVSILATGCEKLKARDQLNKGVQAFKSAQYATAVEHFERAVQLDPSFPVARLYLATAYMQQWIPGAESPENNRYAENAYKEFQRVLQQEPKNEVATEYIASLFFNQKKMADAEQWYRKLIEINPQRKEAYYTLGVIAWTNVFQPRAEARAKLGMKPEDPGPLKDKKVRADLQVKSSPAIEEGLKNLEKALQLDPEYDDAMAYLNLLYREKADLQETPAEFQKLSDIADNWVQKALETKKIKAERKPAGGGITAE